MDSVKPALVQRLFRPNNATKWYSEFLINDHPDGEIFENPVWCLSDRVIIGFNQKKLYKWDSQTGELLTKRKPPSGATHCVIGKRVFHCANIIYIYIFKSSFLDAFRILFFTKFYLNIWWWTSYNKIVSLYFITKYQFSRYFFNAVNMWESTKYMQTLDIL